MSIETPKVEEHTPAPVAKPVETVAPVENTTAPAATTTEPVVDATKTTETPVVPAKDETIVEATPATEGTLGYKAPGLLKQFRYVKHFFWFSEEPLSKEATDSYVRNEKVEAHHTAAWASETGKGCLFFAKRAEDKATPSGIILLHDAAGVSKIGATDFSFKVGTHTHKFEATTAAERDSWVVAIQKIVSETKDLKAEITGRDTYKKTVDGFSFTPAVAAASSTSPIKTEATPKKSLETPTHAAVTEPGPAVTTEEPIVADKTKKDAEVAKAKKERSQSRKRNSVFGLFGKKDEEKSVEKAEKEHEKEVKHAQKEHAKEEKKIEAEHKTEQAKVEHDSSKAVEAAEASVVAAAPATVAHSVEKKEAEKPVEEVTTPSDKKNKRSSVFGGFFNKNKVASPTHEKTLEEAGPVVPAKDESSAVSETAPKLDEPIETKPIDTAAVTAPVDNVETSVPATTEAPRGSEPMGVLDTTTPKTEKKSFLAGLMKKDKKEEPKVEHKTNEDVVQETSTPVVAPAEATTATATEPTVETPVKEAEVAKEERPAREKRRTSLFASIGTLKRKGEKSPEPSTAATETKTETKREKSPMPSKIGGLFRKPSKATKTETPTEVKKDETVAAPITTETPVATETAPAATNSAIVGDVVPETLHTTFHDQVTEKPTEVKTTA